MCTILFHVVVISSVVSSIKDLWQYRPEEEGLSKVDGCWGRIQEELNCCDMVDVAPG